MLPLDKLDYKTKQKIRVACAYLFSYQFAMDDSAIIGLDKETVKKAYKKKTLQYHPDRRPNESNTIINKAEERFKKINDSYKILSSNLQQKTQLSLNNITDKKKIIAIGGAKGGIGKSIFTANLGVLLSAKGYKTMVVDLDLGGSNLHLYLGETYLKRSINDFLSKKSLSLKEIMILNKYGPLLIGGDSSQLGASNINFSRKLKLLKSLRYVEADFVILDLGGDISYNIVDFFLAADYGIVVTTCDPASYLEAYQFIKVAMYRKLNRLFGPESRLRDRKDTNLQKLIFDSTMSTDGSRIETIEKLKERVKMQQYHNYPLIMEAITTFNPSLVFNKVRDYSNVVNILKHIQKTLKQNLSIEVKHLGNISYQSKIEDSARDLVPIISRYSDGNFANEINRIFEKLL